MAYWTAARYMLAQERLALHFLRLAGFEVYLPRLREQRILRGRRVEVTPPLFPGYCFVAIELQWHAAHRAPGTNGLVMNGGGPAHVPDNVIAELKSRERNGFIELQQAARPTYRLPREGHDRAVRRTAWDLRRHEAAPAGRGPAHAARRAAAGQPFARSHRAGVTASRRGGSGIVDAIGGLQKAELPQSTDPPSHGENRGSSPLGSASEIKYLARKTLLVSNGCPINGCEQPCTRTENSAGRGRP